MGKGYVYILVNPEIPGVLKIGMTTKPTDERAAQLNTTGVPGRWEVIAERLVPDCRDVEKCAHYILREFRVSDDREFFRCSASHAEHVLDFLHRNQIKEWLDEFMPSLSSQLSQVPSDVPS